MFRRTRLQPFKLAAFGLGALAMAFAVGPALCTNAPKMVIPEKTKIVDNVEGGTDVQFSFAIYNRGNRDLDITNVNPSCGCTSATYDKVIAPGKTGYVKALLHTPTLTGGQLVKSVLIQTNDPAYPQETLYMVAQMIPAYQVTPNPMWRTDYEKVQPIVQTFTVTPRNTHPIKLVGTPIITGPAQAVVQRDDRAGTYKIIVTLTPPEAGGDISATVDVNTNTPTVPPVHLSLTAIGLKGISVSPASASFGVLPLTSQHVHCTVGVFSRGDKFQITRIQSDDPAISVQYSPQPGAITWYDVKLTYKGGWTAGIHQGKVEIDTDRPDVPQIELPYWADVQ